MQILSGSSVWVTIMHIYNNVYYTLSVRTLFSEFFFVNETDFEEPGFHGTMWHVLHVIVTGDEDYLFSHMCTYAVALCIVNSLILRPP